VPVCGIRPSETNAAVNERQISSAARTRNFRRNNLTTISLSANRQYRCHRRVSFPPRADNHQRRRNTGGNRRIRAFESWPRHRSEIKCPVGVIAFAGRSTTGNAVAIVRPSGCSRTYIRASVISRTRASKAEGFIRRAPRVDRARGRFKRDRGSSPRVDGWRRILARSSERARERASERERRGRL